MPIANSCIHSRANACITAATTRELAQISGLFTENSVESVACVAALPSASENTGRMIFVTDISAYRYSNGSSWTNDYDTTCRVGRSELWAWGDTDYYFTPGKEIYVCRSSPVQETCQAGDWSHVSTGYVHSAYIKTNGTAWGIGSNTAGQLGNNSTTGAFTCSPVQEASSSTNWSKVCISGLESVGFTNGLKSDGTIWSWGSGCYGRLGVGNCISYSSPVQEASSSTNWCFVSGGSRQGIGIKTDGSLFEWGFSYNPIGQHSSPSREISSATNWCKASGGCFYSLAIKTDGTLWGWGQNTTALAYAPLGSGDTINYSSPVQEASSSTNWTDVSAGRDSNPVSSAITTAGTAYWWGYYRHSSPVQELCSATNWCSVSTGDDHIVFLKTDSTLWSMLANCCGVFGNNTASVLDNCYPQQEITSSSDWCQISAGKFTTQAIKAVYKGFNTP